MFRSYKEMEDFRANCVCLNSFDYYDAYEEIAAEVYDDDTDERLFRRIEKHLFDWIKLNAKSDVYYRGDLLFEFESEDECAQFDVENGDPMAFKLMWT